MLCFFDFDLALQLLLLFTLLFFDFEPPHEGGVGESPQPQRPEPPAP
jgi:hypothetical protein